jgi:translation initiation factor IF-3
VPRVRLVDVDGEQVGIKERDEALEYAWGKNLDLVEVAPDANPPVCRVMDYSKYKYELEQKQKLARKHQSTITIKEIKLRPKIDPHDYATKRGHVERFLRNRDKVKVTIMFRGPELRHPDRGRTLLMRLADDVKELGLVESEPLQEGRNMTMMLGPVKEAAPPVARPKDEPAADASPQEGGETAIPETAPVAAAAEIAPEPEPEPVAAAEPEPVAAAEPEPAVESAPEPEPEPAPAAAPKPKAAAKRKAAPTPELQPDT